MNLKRGRKTDEPSLSERKRIVKRIDKIVEKNDDVDGILLYREIRRELSAMVNISMAKLTQILMFQNKASFKRWKEISDAITKFSKQSRINKVRSRLKIN